MSDEELPEPKPVTYRIDRIIPAFTLMVVVSVLGYRFFDLIYLYSVNVFFFDQWDFLTPFFEDKAGFMRLFLIEPTPFREGLGLIADKFLYSATGWNVRAESLMIGCFVFAALLLALLLKRRLTGKLSLGDIAIPMIFLTLQQYETFIGTPNPSYSAIPLLLILLYCLALLQKQYKFRYSLCLALNVFLVYTGYGLIMGPITVGLFALESYRNWRRAGPVPLAWPLGALGIAAGTLAAFFIDYKFSAGVECFVFPNPDPWVYPRFLALMIGVFMDFALWPAAMTFAGALCLAAVLAILVVLFRRLFRGRRFRDGDLIAAVLLTYSALFAADAAVGRACLGLPGAALSSRYVTQLIPGALGVYLYLQSLAFSSIRRISVGIFILLLIPGTLFIPPKLYWFSYGKRAWARCYVLTEDIPRCDKTTDFQIYPRPEVTKLKEKLDYLKERQLNLFAVF